MQGEWWRLITALTLHADQMHLVGNCLIGGVIVHLLCKAIGYGMGWLALLFAAMSGNFLNIILRDTLHSSVGFSTAVFAAVGILSGRQLNNRASTIIRQLILPLGAGVGLLAMLGSAGERTDLGAHLLAWPVECFMACFFSSQTLICSVAGADSSWPCFCSLFLSRWLLAAGNRRRIPGLPIRGVV